MPVGLGLACSSSPVLYRPRDQWEDIYKQLIGPVEQDLRAAEETPEKLDEYAGRIEAGFAELRGRLEAYRPDALVVLFSDKGRLFDETQVPQLFVYKGDEIWGSTRYTDLGEEESESARVTIPCHNELGDWLMTEMTWAGLDISQGRDKFNPQGDPEGGAGHSLTDAVLKLVPKLNIPIIPFHINGHRNPAISGRRVVAVGRTIAQVFDERPERIALLASGGLSGDPRGYLGGWVDARLDDWVLTRLQRGRTEELGSLWDMDSNTLRGSTREVRTWMAVGAAMEMVGAKAVLADYIRFNHAAVGTGFAWWDPQEASSRLVRTLAGSRLHPNRSKPGRLTAMPT